MHSGCVCRLRHVEEAGAALLTVEVVLEHARDEIVKGGVPLEGLLHA